MVELSSLLLKYFFMVVLLIGVWGFLIVASIFGTFMGWHEGEYGWMSFFGVCSTVGVISLPLMFSIAHTLHRLVVSGHDEPKTEVVAIENRRYKLLEINPPKHMRVHLQDVESGYSTWASVSKHCNNWRDNQIGAEYNIDVKVLKKGEREWREFTGLSRVFC